MKNTIYQWIVGSLLTMTLLSACSPETVYEGYKQFPAKQWLVDSTVVFSFNIDNHRAFYDISYNVRNTISYPYYNLYTQTELIDASGKVLWTKLLDNNLLDPKTGEPYGTGIGDVYDHEIMLLKTYQFPTKGTYTLKFRQQMRNDSLPEIMAVGIKIRNAHN